jgi:hypothetical protein
VRVAAGKVRLTEEARRVLGARPGDLLHLVPFE